MTATLNQIAGYLENRDWQYDLQIQKFRIVTGVIGDNIDPLAITITLKEDGKYLELSAPQIMFVNDRTYQTALQQTLMEISAENKMLCWAYDWMDGKISASIALPLEDSLLTEQQFDRCLNSLIYIVDMIAMPRIKALLSIGIDWEQKEFGEQLLLMLQDVLPGSLSLLENALTARKYRGMVS